MSLVVGCIGGYVRRHLTGRIIINIGVGLFTGFQSPLQEGKRGIEALKSIYLGS